MEASHFSKLQKPMPLFRADDVKAVMPDVLAHRLMLSPKGKSAFENERKALENIALTVKSPDAIEK